MEHDAAISRAVRRFTSVLQNGCLRILLSLLTSVGAMHPLHAIGQPLLSLYIASFISAILCTRGRCGATTPNR